MEKDNVYYLYINKFVYKNKDDEEAMGGHPKSGRVYRAFKSPDNNNYKIHIGSENNPAGLDGISLRTLKGKSTNWECDIVAITDETLLDLDITPADIAKIKLWEQEDNKSLIELVQVPSQELTKVPVYNNTESIFETASDYNAPKESKQPHDPWPEFSNAVFDLLDYIDSTFSDKYAASPISTKDILMSADYGKGFNCGNALKYISRYCTEGFDKSNNPQDLYKAVHYLLFELTRRNTNG